MTIHAAWDDDTAVWSVVCDEVPSLRIEVPRFADIEAKVRTTLGPDITGGNRRLVVRANWPRYAP